MVTDRMWVADPYKSSGKVMWYTVSMLIFLSIWKKQNGLGNFNKCGLQISKDVGNKEFLMFIFMALRGIGVHTNILPFVEISSLCQLSKCYPF